MMKKVLAAFAISSLGSAFAISGGEDRGPESNSKIAARTYVCTYKDAASNPYEGRGPTETVALEAAQRACYHSAKVCFFAGCPRDIFS